MVDTWELRVPVSGCEATKYEPLSCLHHSQCPPPLIATPVKILRTPPISVRIVDPLESRFRIFISHEFEDHLTVGGGANCFGSSEICHGVILRGGDRGKCLRNRYFSYLLSFGFFKDRLWLIPPKLYNGLSEEMLEIFFRFFQILTQSSNFCILLLDDGR
jgi:hypothetical protein